MKKYCSQYRHCPICSAKLVDGGEDYLICSDSNCSKRLYLSPKPTVSALIFNDKNQVLLCKGVNPPTKDLWDIPGGFISLDETAEKATVRELLEEIGLTIYDLEYVNSYPCEYLFEGVNYPTLNFVFTVKVKGSSDQTD